MKGSRVIEVLEDSAKVETSHPNRPLLAFSLAACSGCGACLVTCPHRALSRAPSGILIDAQRCTSCWECVEICPRDALVPSLALG